MRFGQQLLCTYLVIKGAQAAFSAIESGATKRGCIAELHTVTTEDGWDLSMIRIYEDGVFDKEEAADETEIDDSARRLQDEYGDEEETAEKSEDSSTPAKEPEIVKRIFLQHGWFKKGEDWILSAEADRELPYHLALEGYDVWIGTSRGTGRPEYSSRSGLDAEQDDEQYWGYTIDEMAKYDFPASVDYIIEKTPADKLIVIAENRGALTALQATSRGYYGDKIERMILMQPCFWVNLGTEALYYEDKESFEGVKQQDLLDDYEDAFKVFGEEDVHVVFDDYWEQNKPNVCPESTLCPLLDKYASSKTEPVTVRELEQIQQIKMSQQFQQYVETQEYINSGIGSNKIYLNNVYGFLIDVIYAADDIRCPMEAQDDFIKDLQNVATINKGVDVPLGKNLWPDFQKSKSYNDLIARLIRRQSQAQHAQQLSLSIIVAGALAFAQAML